MHPRHFVWSLFPYDFSVPGTFVYEKFKSLSLLLNKTFQYTHSSFYSVELFLKAIVKVTEQKYIEKNAQCLSGEQFDWESGRVRPSIGRLRKPLALWTKTGVVVVHRYPQTTGRSLNIQRLRTETVFFFIFFISISVFPSSIYFLFQKRFTAVEVS